MRQPRQDGGARRSRGALTEAAGLVPIALLREVHFPAAILLLLESVSEAELRAHTCTGMGVSACVGGRRVRARDGVRALQPLGACLSNNADAIRRNDRKQAHGGTVAQRKALLVGGTELRLLELCKRGDTRLLHVLPGQPPADALIVHLLNLAGLLGLCSQVDQLRQRIGLHLQHSVVRREVGVAKGGDADEPI